jgi:hypothetical protein
MKLVERKYKVVGIFPLLMNNPAKMVVGSNGPKTKHIPTPEEEAEKGLYVDDDGNFYLPSNMFRACLLNGLKGKRIGKLGAATVFKPAVFNVDEQTVVLDAKTMKPKKDYIVDTRRAVVQNNGVMRSRPKFTEWAAIVRLLLDEEVVSPEMVAEHLDIAGKTTGVGDYRIARGGPFGSFYVDGFGEK